MILILRTWSSTDPGSLLDWENGVPFLKKLMNVKILSSNKMSLKFLLNYKYNSNIYYKQIQLLYDPLISWEAYLF